MTEQLVEYIHRAHTWSPEFIEARQQSVSLPHDYTPDLAGIQASVLLIHGRYDRMVPFEVTTTIPQRPRASCFSITAGTGRRSRSQPSGPRRSSIPAGVLICPTSEFRLVFGGHASVKNQYVIMSFRLY